MKEGNQNFHHYSVNCVQDNYLIGSMTQIFHNLIIYHKLFWWEKLAGGCFGIGMESISSFYTAK